MVRELGQLCETTIRDHEGEGVREESHAAIFDGTPGAVLDAIRHEARRNRTGFRRILEERDALRMHAHTPARPPPGARVLCPTRFSLLDDESYFLVNDLPMSTWIR